MSRNYKKAATQMCDYCKREVWLCKKCSACKERRYCSPTCQKEDWPDHKEICNKIKGAPQSNPQTSVELSAKKVGPFEYGVDVGRLEAQEKHTWDNVWQENDRNLCGDLWRTFSVDGMVPLEHHESRSIREMFRWLGSQPAYGFLAPFGEEWVGGYETTTATPEHNEKILTWVKKLCKMARIDSKVDLDYTDFIRLVLRRRYDYIMEGRKDRLSK